MAKVQPIETPTPGSGTDPVEESATKPTVTPPGDRPDPFIRGLGNEPETT